MAGIGAADIPDAAAFDAYVGPARELTVDPARGIARLHDGTTPGGKNLVSESASVIAYDNDASGLAAENLQDAIDELADREALPAGGTTGQVLVKVSATDGDVTWKSVPLPRGYISGLTLQNNATDAANDIDILPGKCRDIDDTVDLVLGTTLTKRLDAAWAAGSGNGGLDTGTKANNAWYHVHLIRRTSDGVLDGIFSGSIDNPSLPSGWVARRRLGAEITDGSGAIRGFVQTKDYFGFKAPVSVVAANTALTGTVTHNLQAGVPTGKKFRINVFISVTAPTAGYLGIKDPDEGVADSSILSMTYPASSVASGWSGDLFTNASAQISTWGQRASLVVAAFYVTGFYDDRERI
jgi:hypothetical protein